MRIGIRPAVLHGYDHGARVRSIYKYANSETYYRTPNAIARCFRDAGLRMDNRRAAKAFISARARGLPLPVSLAGPVLNWLWTSVVCARKPASARF
jgi:hypothetical protein